MVKERARVLVIDGNHLAYRSYYKVGYLRTESSAVDSGVLFGAIRTLHGLVVKFQPHLIVAVFDGKPTKQRQLYPEYKHGRPAKASGFRKQLRDVRRVFRALGIVVIRDPNSEADPIVSALAGWFTQVHKFRVTIVSSDSDYFQCLERGVVMYDAIRQRTLTKPYVLSRFGVRTLGQYVLLKSIIGDRSDNIPPVKRGVGPKTAAKIVTNHDEYAKFSMAHAKALKRNFQLIMLPQSFINTPSWVLQKLRRHRRVRSGAVKRILRKYEVRSVLTGFKTWCLPFRKLAVTKIKLP